MFIKPGAFIQDIEYKDNFEVLWEPPTELSFEDPELDDPIREMTLFEIGPENIVDSITVTITGPQLDINIDPQILGKMVPEQRQVVICHILHILSYYFTSPVDELKDYLVKAEILRHMIKLARLEEEPGEFH